MSRKKQNSQGYTEPSEDDLSPCRCGGAPGLFQDGSGNKRWWVECCECGMATPHDGFGDPVARWERVMSTQVTSENMETGPTR